MIEDLKVGICEHCEWSFWLPAEGPPERCPFCFCGSLVLHESPEEILPFQGEPERVIPFSLSAEAIAGRVLAFADRIPFAPPDLQPETLAARLEQIYLPLWLVDADLRANWQAEMGFNYEVVSHQDRFSDSRGWVSNEVTEGRVRWEPRLGRLARRYENVSVPALEDHGDLAVKLGGFELDEVKPFSVESLAEASLRIPNRSQQDAWPAALPAIQSRASDECRQAAGADYIRQFRWQPEDQNQHWTLLLYPLYATYYQADDKTPQQLLINGRTGVVSGTRRSSERRAARASTTILVIAGVLFLLGLLTAIGGLVLPPLLLAGGIGLFISLLAALAAAVPRLVAWQFNRAQQN